MSFSPSLVAKRTLQQQRVRKLYRHSLKHLLSWSVQREIFYEEADKLRDQFDANKGESNPERIERLIAAGEARLWANQHPDPYTVPWAYCGSKYARNPPVPQEIQVVLDFGKQQD